MKTELTVAALICMAMFACLQTDMKQEDAVLSKTPSADEQTPLNKTVRLTNLCSFEMDKHVPSRVFPEFSKALVSRGKAHACREYRSTDAGSQAARGEAGV